ncbi:MAG: PDZ domain-containing protein [bacterium]|nr:PDZ domain-containing protein [bacterium]
MKKLIIWSAILTLILMITSVSAAEEQGFLRYPDAFRGQVAFTSEGDLWIVSLDGGIARRLTTHDGDETYPKFSPDGKWIAFSGQYEGNQDVYVIPVEGGEPRRLTFHSGGEGVVGWTNDGKIMFRTLAFSGDETQSIYTVSPEGGYPVNMGLDEAALASWEPNGTRVAYTRFFRNNATWKRYKGGLSDQIWVADPIKKQYGKKAISTYVGHNSYPMWVGDRIYFLSDSTGRKNIWSMKPDGSDQKQHTLHKDYDARWPSDGDGCIVYQLAMDVWKYDVKSGKTSKIEIQLPSDRIYTRTRIIDPSGYVTGFDLNKDGGWMVIAARGQLFSVPTKSRESLVRRLTPDFKSRAKSPFFLGNQVVALTDITGEDEFFQFDPFLKKECKQLSRDNHMWRYDGQPSPDEKWIAFDDGNMTLSTLNVATGEIKKIATGKAWEIRDYSWSPDSRYIAYTNPENEVIQTIHVYDTKEGQDHAVTDLMYNCYFPTWDPKGQRLYFLEEANFNPMTDMYYAQFTVYTPDKLYMYLLSKDAKNPFAPDSSLLAMKEEEKDKDKDKDKAKEEKDDKKDKGKDKDKKKKDDDEKKDEEKVVVKIDWDGLQDRMVEIPVSPGYYAGLRAAEDMLYYLSGENRGQRTEEEQKLALNLYKFEERKNHTVMEDVKSYDISDDGKVVVAYDGSTFTRMDAGVTSKPEGEGDEDPTVKLDNWSIRMEPRQEWQQMFQEAWRIQRDFFYDPQMYGMDWSKVLKTYESLINRISTRSELNDLIGEMIGELCSGHAYVFGGDLHQPDIVQVGLLGADISRDAGSGFFKIDKIYSPDRAFEEYCSPLSAPQVKAQVGDYIVAIDGIATNTVDSYLELLQDKANCAVVLTLNGKPSVTGGREVIITTIGNEDEMRYQDWVKSRRDYVYKASGGKIGYLHLSDMQTNGLWQFGHQYYPQFNKEGMILDVRHNGGGSVAQILLAQLNRKVWSAGRARRGGVYRTPSVAFYGYYAICCDEKTGSDGETFTLGSKLLELGPVYGKRTWGGWVGIRGDKPLNDKVWFTTPEFGGWGVFGSDKGKWLIEGHGVDPDVVVENDPGSVLAGKDPQLDAAIEYLLKKMKDQPKVLPEEPPIPKRDVNY